MSNPRDYLEDSPERAAYDDYLDGLAERGEPATGVLTFEEFCARQAQAPAPDPAPLCVDASEIFGDDDIPF